jgi:multisubunit Na+/H+ antiporter MnhF subunit
VFIAAVVGAFLDPQGLVGYLLIAAMAGVYATIRVTRGRPLRRRLVAVAAVFAVPLTFAGVLDRLGY